jgi:hypothetical protein
MDLAAAGPIVAFALGGIFTAVVGAGAAEFRARQDARRASAGSRDDRVRTFRLDQLHALGRSVRLWLGELANWAAGDDDEKRLWAEAQRRGEGPAEWVLLGDREVVEAVHRLEQRLYAIGYAGGLTLEDVAAMDAVELALDRALAQQEERILRDEPPRLVSDEEASALRTAGWEGLRSAADPRWRVPGARRIAKEPEAAATNRGE